MIWVVTKDNHANINMVVYKQWYLPMFTMSQCQVNVVLWGTSLVVQWVRLHAPNAGGPGSIPGRGSRSRMHATTKKSECRNQRSRVLQLKIPRAATKTQCSLNK